MLGIGAILGNDLFVPFPVVTFDYPSERLVLGRESPASS